MLNYEATERLTCLSEQLDEVALRGEVNCRLRETLRQLQGAGSEAEPEFAGQ